MPRLAPRLAKAIASSLDKEKYFPCPFPKKIRRKKSLHDQNQTLSRPSFNFREYDRSILLSDAEYNPITNSRAYELHKSLPPSVTLPKGAKARDGERDKPREMTEHERKLWSSPYLRMLSSPTRLCTETDQYLPSDLLIRLSYLRLPQSRLQNTAPSLAIVPDGLQHPKFTARKSGRGFHVLCLREAVDQMLQTGSYRRTTRESSVTPNPHLSDQIAHLLRLRVLQEFERLAQQMRHHIRLSLQDGNSPSIIRRLTLDELVSVKSTGTIPFKNAVAVIVVPPVNRNVITKKHPLGSMSAMPPEQASHPGAKPLPPLSVLMPMNPDSQSFSNHHSMGGLLPKKTIPFYNGLTAFPHASQRAALHDLLTRLLSLERDRRSEYGFNATREAGDHHYPNSKPSHAFLLCSDQENVKRGDVAAVAIALWRLRMFEGGGWGDGAYSWSFGTDRDTQKLL